MQKEELRLHALAWCSVCDVKRVVGGSVLVFDAVVCDNFR